MMFSSLSHEGPYSIRYPRGNGVMPEWRTAFQQIPLGQGRIVKEGEEVAILTIGHIGNYAVEACETLSAEGLNPAHYDMRFVKPLDEELLHEVFGKFKKVITVEDGCLMGGFGSAVLEWMMDHEYQAQVKRLGIPDEVVEHGEQIELHRACGFDPDGNSPLEKSHLSLEELAVMLEEWMEENEIFEPIVIGHSLGGYVTLALLELMQQKLKAVGLFHSTAFADDADKKQMRNRAITFLKKNGVDKFVTSFVPQLFPEDRRKELSTAIETALEQAKESTLEGLIAFTEAMRDRKDRTQVLEHFHGPKLLIAGTEDGSVKLEASRKQSYLFTDYFELENTGHMGMFERKGETLALIKNF